VDLVKGALTGEDYDLAIVCRASPSPHIPRRTCSNFTINDNQPSLREAIHLTFVDRGQPDFSEMPSLDHGRIEQRSIWTSTRLNDYLDFPSVGQVFVIQRQSTNKKTGKTSTDIVYGVTSHTPDTASAAAILVFNRHHWTIENGCGSFKTTPGIQRSDS